MRRQWSETASPHGKQISVGQVVAGVAYYCEYISPNHGNVWVFCTAMENISANVNRSSTVEPLWARVAVDRLKGNIGGCTGRNPGFLLR